LRFMFMWIHKTRSVPQYSFIFVTQLLIYRIANYVTYKNQRSHYSIQFLAHRTPVFPLAVLNVHIVSFNISGNCTVHTPWERT